MQTEANFVNGDGLKFEVPEGFHSTVDSTGIITLAGRPRTITFISYDRRGDPRNDTALKHRFDIREGAFRVEVYETMDSPPETLRAVWRFPKGALATFLQDDSGCGLDLTVGMRFIIGKTDVSLSRFAMPVVRTKQPLGSGDPRSPMERETMTLWPHSPAAGPVQLMKFTREPPWITEGRRKERWRDQVATAITTRFGVTVSVAGHAAYQQDVERTAETVVESLVPVQ